MIRYDGEVVYSESGSGIRANNRMLFNEAQVSAIKAITNGEFKRQSDFGTVYVVKDQLVDDYGVLEVIKVFEQLDNAQKYVMAHPRAALLPRKVIKHGKIEKQK
ncbi:hypothetical protein CBF86_08420 [Limosilactobacillus reuteri]|uniref:hypothetical protein n=1 Tax=Limosilactobacillus reuteri TaxID=1598 RepID=UPI000B9909A1|nr:hypothetical protein [Limosilactobacillus reuteri]OYS46553.1 hypothetical protein CBF86_08420 [Limosilactobacillus reuteri]OYS48301.1 hypothetical protein CBF84_08235 [Limosilactobacillus reuteri]OYS52771.1 hypothetical protein CBF95_10185 [Limosilactobacillus reuteri]OYS53095.1 hypothetical protein CBF92_07000 [Limosilactobacillus reuteri]OYS63544.1 hypothetical protein CBF93_01755 [Limosilactobacillus reuteri]